jgi:MATE family multidrug resistance protein
MQFKYAIRELLKLSGPIIMGQIGLMMIGAGDVYIASLYSSKSVGAIGVANGVINPVFLFGVGLMMGISPKLSFKRGEGQTKREDLSTVLGYSSLIGLFIAGLTLLVNLLVPHIGLEQELVPSVIAYNQIVAWSFPFAIVYSAIKEYLQAYEDVMLPNIINIVAVFFNLVVNYILVFGLGSFEGIGEIGLAWASFITRFVLMVFILIYALKKEEVKQLSLPFGREILSFSLPIAFMFFLEVLAFCVVSILSGKISVLAAATNNIILTIASTAFMVPMSIGSASAVKVGHAFGEKNYFALTDCVKSALSLGLLFAICASTFFFFGSRPLMSLLSNDPEVIELGVSLLKIVAVFQFVDSIQVILTGVLRGMKYVNSVSVIAFTGYWLVGIPTGVYLTFFAGYGVKGLWIGLAVSLAMVAIGLFFFLLKKLSQFGQSTLIPNKPL